MDNMKNIVVTSVVVSVVVVLAAYFVLPRGNTVVNNQIPDNTLGAVPGNEINGNFFTVGGVERAYVKQNWIATTTRVCMIPNPFRATSTLVSFTARNTNTVAGANSFDISTTTHAGGYGATSSTYILRDFTIPANSYNQTDGYTNGSSANLPVVISGRESVRLFRSATSTAGTDNYQGICTAIFQKL